MSKQTLDLTRSARIVWRHKLVAAAIVATALVGNVAYTVLQPQVFTASTLVVLSPSANLDTQSVVVESIPVLSDAMRRESIATPLNELQNLVTAKRAAVQVIMISVHGDDPAWAVRTANAVTLSYIDYIGSSRNPAGHQPARLLLGATAATVKPLSTRVYEAAILGLLMGLLVSLVSVLAIWRGDRRLRERDEIADSIGVPVLASVTARCPKGAAGWATFLGQDVQAPNAWQLREALLGLGFYGTDTSAAGASVAVLSLSNDRDALALGPLLALASAAAGVPTTLLVGTQQDDKAVVALRDVCAAAVLDDSPKLRVRMVSDGDAEVAPGALTVIVGLVNGQTPRVTMTTRADITVLGVTAGAARAEQLVRVVASAASDGRALAGVLVANASRADQTTGRVPRLARPQQNRMPTRLGGVMTESRQ